MMYGFVDGEASLRLDGFLSSESWSSVKVKVNGFMEIIYILSSGTLLSVNTDDRGYINIDKWKSI